MWCLRCLVLTNNLRVLYRHCHCLYFWWKYNATYIHGNEKLQFKQNFFGRTKSALKTFHAHILYKSLTALEPEIFRFLIMHLTWMTLYTVSERCLIPYHTYVYFYYSMMWKIILTQNSLNLINASTNKERPAVIYSWINIQSGMSICCYLLPSEHMHLMISCLKTTKDVSSALFIGIHLA